MYQDTPVHCGVVLAGRSGFESWFWVGVTFWLFLVCDIGDDKDTDVTQDVPYTGVIPVGFLHVDYSQIC